MLPDPSNIWSLMWCCLGLLCLCRLLLLLRFFLFFSLSIPFLSARKIFKKLIRFSLKIYRASLGISFLRSSSFVLCLFYTILYYRSSCSSMEVQILQQYLLQHTHQIQSKLTTSIRNTHVHYLHRNNINKSKGLRIVAVGVLRIKEQIIYFINYVFTCIFTCWFWISFTIYPFLSYWWS